MVYPKSGWLNMGIQCVVVASVMVLFVGCANTPPATQSEADAQTAVQTLGEVTVERDGSGSLILLEGLDQPIYSVTGGVDSNLLIIDLVGVGATSPSDLTGDMSGEDRQVAAYDGVIDLVSFSTFDEEGGAPLTRVEVLMSSTGEADVFSTGDGLAIRVVPTIGSSSSGEGDVAVTSDGMPGDAGVEDWNASDEMVATEVAVVTPVSVEPPPAATQLTNIGVQTTDAGVLIGIEANGSIGALEAFTLENPARLVVDLPGLAAGDAPAQVAVDSDFVTNVRMGAHASKVRIVVDGGAAAGDFEGRQLMPGTTGLWVAIGDGEDLSAAMGTALDSDAAAWTASREPVSDSASGFVAVSDESVDELSDEEVLATAGMESASADTAGWETEGDAFAVTEETTDGDGMAVTPVVAEDMDLAEVYGLHYERTEGMDRTAILADDAVEYTTTSPDATTLVVSIPNAGISPAASDRIFPERGGPVSLIHAFQQPDVEIPEVRVVFTRAPNQEPVVSRRGSMIFVDFADLGVAAAAPPAFPNAGGDAADMAAADSMAGDTTVVAAPNGFDADGNASGDPASVGVPMAAPDGSVAVVDSSMQMAAVDTAVAGELPSFSASDGDMVDIPASPGPGVDPSVWAAPASPSPAAVEVPAAIEVLEEGGLIDGKEYRGRRVSLDFKDVAIADVLRLIAEVSDLNIIAGDEVAGNVTIRLVEVPWDQALDVILMTKGLGFVRVGNVLRIAPSDVLKAEEEVRLQERRNKEKLEDLEVKLLPVNYAQVKDTEGLVKRLLSARGTVNLDERTNTLIIKDISSVIDEASALIAAIDTQTPQVMIEAKIVEANLDFSRELGSVWGIQTQRFEDPFDPDTQRTDLGSDEYFTAIGENGLAFANPITSVPTGLMTVGALILNQDFRIDAQIQAAESTGDGKVVSSPRIVTLDNKEAKIEQGVSIPFQTFEGGDAKLEFIDAVLSLIVTPHITADMSIIMEIEVTRNAPDDTVATPTGSPAISKNVAETETLVKDGQTLVLGGIYTIIKSKRQSRIPYLHRIPVIGNLFKNNEVTDARKELLVFVTPRIVRLPEMAGG